jgi:hypothetical protein
MWVPTDSNEVHQSGGSYCVKLETERKAIGHSRSWVFEKLRKGQLPAKKIGGSVFIARADLLSMIEAAPSYIEARAATTA